MIPPHSAGDLQLALDFHDVNTAHQPPKDSYFVVDLIWQMSTTNPDRNRGVYNGWPIVLAAYIPQHVAFRCGLCLKIERKLAKISRGKQER